MHRIAVASSLFTLLAVTACGADQFTPAADADASVRNDGGTTTNDSGVASDADMGSDADAGRCDYSISPTMLERACTSSGANTNCAVVLTRKSCCVSVAHGINHAGVSLFNTRESTATANCSCPVDCAMKEIVDENDKIGACNDASCFTATCDNGTCVAKAN